MALASQREESEDRRRAGTTPILANGNEGRDGDQVRDFARFRAFMKLGLITSF
jgi:hypothetical protein